jgi:hypothetical protein
VNAVRLQERSDAIQDDFNALVPGSDRLVFFKVSCGSLDGRLARLIAPLLDSLFSPP